MDRMLEDGSTLEVSEAAYDAAIAYHEWATENRRRAMFAYEKATEILENAGRRLALQEDRPGIPLYNRCPACGPNQRGSVRLPIGHDGECDS